MDSSTFTSRHADVLRALDQHRLLDALRELASLSAEGAFGSISVRLERLREDYAMMLGCLEQGMDDPDRERIYGQFLQRAAVLADEAKHAWLAAQPAYFGTVYRRSAAASGPYTTEAAFDRVYASAPFSREDYERYAALLGDADTPAALKHTLTAALLLALMHVFDARKLRLLADGVYDHNAGLRARCLVGTALAAFVHRDRIGAWPELEAQLSLLADAPDFAAALRIVQLQLLLSLRTQQDSQRMSEDILPEMMRMARKMSTEEGMDFTKLSEVDLEMNPEWGENGRSEALQKAMRGIVEMQDRGVDLFFRTFERSMRWQPFFAEAAHWFVPFSFQNEVFRGRGHRLEHLNLLFNTKPACNTEKYMMALAFMQMPDDSLATMGKSMGQLDVLHDRMPEAGAGTDDTTDAGSADPYGPLRVAVRLYVHDLYRFFHLFRHRSEMSNPFEGGLRLSEVPCFRAAMSQPLPLLAFGNFCFEGRQWAEALSFLEQLPEDEKDAEAFEKMGYCCMMEKEHAKAVRYFDCANMIRPGSTWTLRQLARACMAAGRPEQAREALAELERMAPDDARVLLMAAECDMKMGDDEQALNRLHKANYLQPDSRVQRALAWCLLKTGRYAEARDQYDRLLHEEPVGADYLNAGHAAWLQGNVKGAVHDYRKSLELQKQDAAPADFFREDGAMLLAAGKSDLDLQLMRDLINQPQNRK